MLVSKFIHDMRGGVLVETTLILPLFLLATLGTVDVAYMLSDWAVANKAAYAGAHRAIVSNPVAQGLISLYSTTNASIDPNTLGTSCSNQANGASAGVCPTVTVTCTPSSGGGGSCSGGYTFDDTAFQNILGRMQAIYGCTNASTCLLQPQNVQIAYTTNGLGFVGDAWPPMNVTVSVQCLVHQFYFIGALMKWTFAPAAGCNGPVTGWPVPAYATTLTSEDLGCPSGDPNNC
jgi:Na+-transporting NADH:ubiquinone oxidoreductase subunit NqrB